MLRRRLLAGGLLAAVALTVSSPEAAQRRQAAPRDRADVARFRARVEALLAGKDTSVPGPRQRPAQARDENPLTPEQVRARIPKGHWGLLVADAATGEVHFERNADSYFTPASNTKLFTTVLALAHLGPDYRYRTTVETRGALDRHGRLRGDLVLVGRGDPNLSNRKLPMGREVERDGVSEKVVAALADAVVARGIRQIEGDVVGDDSWFSLDRYPSGWAIEDMPFGYGAPVSALSVNDNTILVEIRAGERPGEPAWFGVEPWAEFYEFRNEIETVDVGNPRRLRAEREPGSRRVVLRGTMPIDSQPQTITLAVDEPAEFAAALLKRQLELRGVRVYGAARARHTPDADPVAPVVLAEHASLPLIESVRVINKVSQNLHTEMLLRTVAREKAGEGSTEVALRFAQEFYRSLAIAEGDVAVYDGSGLSRRNLVTPRAAVKLLSFAAQQPWFEAFLSTLPVAGEDGTLSERMRRTSAAGRIRAKTGTLGNVNALSGYATTQHGARVVFSMFGNAHNLRGRDSTDVLDAICLALVEEIGSPTPRKR